MEDLLLKEKEVLRNELVKLKECQVYYFWSSVTATGVILGLGSKLSQGDNVTYTLLNRFDVTFDANTIHLLAPVLIILPCWLIFFDKATTITRIVGFYRVIEYKLLNKDDDRHKFLGWENSLFLLRYFQREEDNRLLHEKMKEYFIAVYKALPLFWKFHISNRYWIITWGTFFILASFCYSLFMIFSNLLWWLKLILFIPMLLSTMHNLYILKNLCNGVFSYDYRWDRWKMVLSSTQANEFYEVNYKDVSHDPLYKGKS